MTLHSPKGGMMTRCVALSRAATASACSLRTYVSALMLCLVCTATSVRATLIDFEELLDLEHVSTQYSGVVFENAVALTAGLSLDEFEFPPHSGSVVVTDAGAPIQIRFANPVTSVGGFFTHFV